MKVAVAYDEDVYKRQLHAHLREKGLDLRFKHAVESYEETEDGIIVHVKDRESIKLSLIHI